MPLPNCDTELFKKFKRSRKKKNVDFDDIDDITKRALHVHKKMLAARKRFSKVADTRKAEQAIKNTLVDNIFTEKLGNVINLKGVDVSRIDRFMVSMFAQNTRGFGAGTTVSAAGRVNMNVKDAKRIGSGLIDVAAKYQGFKKVRDANNAMKRIFRRVGLRDADTINELVLDSIEMGQIPKNRVAYNISEEGDIYNMHRHQEWVDRLRTLGIKQDEIEEIQQAVTEIATSMDEVRATAIALGVDIGKVDGLGFFSRIFNPTARRFAENFERARGLLKDIQQVNIDPNVAYDISRKTFNYVPEDTAVLAYQLNLEIDELNGLIANGQLAKYLHENISEQLLDNMVDMGTLSKLPMTTKEVFNYVVSQYDLPFKGMSEMFVTDPERVFQLYSDALSQAAGESRMMKLVAKDGLENGWAIPTSMFNNAPDTFKGWRKLDANAVKEFFPQANAFSESVYLHPAVGDVWKTYVDVSRSPEKIAGLANMAHYWGTFLTKTLLMRPGYVVHQVMDSFMQTGASGGNLFRMFEGQFDVFKLRSGGLEALDDSRKVYKSLDGDKLISKRELMKELIIHRDTGLAPQTLGQKATSNLNKFNPVQIPRAINYIYSYVTGLAERGGAGAATKGTAKLFSEIIQGAHNDVFSLFAVSASFFEMAGKWTSVMSLADTRAIGKIGQTISGAARPRDFQNLRQIFEHLDNYFYAWDDIGKVDNFVGTFIRPFAPYAFKNPPAQIRQALTNPQQFVNYLRIRQFLNQDFVADPDTNEASIPQYILDGAPVALSKDTESGNWWMLMTTNFDPRADAINFFNDTANELARKRGGFIGTTQQQLEDLEDRPGLTKVFQEWGKETLPIWKNGISLLTGIDVETGRAIEQGDLRERKPFLGLDLPPLATFVLSAYPPLDALDNLNPFGVFGTPEIRDPRTNEIVVEGTTSFAGAKRTSLQLDRYSAGTQQWAVNLAQVLGISVKIVDIARSTQWTFAEMDKQATSMGGALNKTELDLRLEIAKGNQDSAQFRRRVDAYNRHLEQWIQLRYEQTRLALWMKERGIPAKSAFDAFERDAARAIQIEVPGSVMTELMEEAASRHIDVSPAPNGQQQ